MRQQPRGRQAETKTEGQEIEFISSSPDIMDRTLMHKWVGEQEFGQQEMINDSDLAELDAEFTESRIVDTVQGVLTSKRTKPSTKVKLLVKYFGFEFDDAKAAVLDTVPKVGFRRGTAAYTPTTYSQAAKHEPSARIRRGGGGNYEE